MAGETQSEEVAAASGNDVSFGDDDLGRLQGILFGDHARKTAERIDTLEQALLGVVADLRAHVESEFAALNKRLDAETDNRAKAVTNVGERLKEEQRARAKVEKVMRTDLDRTHENLTQALDDLEQRSARSLDDTRGELAAEIEAGMRSIGDISVAREDLAKALRQAAEDIAGATGN